MNRYEQQSLVNDHSSQKNKNKYCPDIHRSIQSKGSDVPSSSDKKIIVCICAIVLLLLSLWLLAQRKYDSDSKAKILESEINKKTSELQQLRSQLQVALNQTTSLKEKYQSKENSQGVLQFQLKKATNKMQTLENQKIDGELKLNKLQKQLKEKASELQKWVKGKEANEKQIKENGKTADLQKRLKEKQMQLQKQIQEKDVKLADLEKRLKEKETQLEKQIKSKVASIQKVPQQIKSNENNKTPSTAYVVDPLRKDSNNKGIADILYKNQDTRKQRERFIKERIDFINRKKNHQWAPLIKYNLIHTKQLFDEAVKENQNDWLRLEQKFKISSVKQELPMCVISSSYNNNARFRIQANLNSVFLQNYTNFKHVVINDVSTDGSNQVYRNYYSFYKIDKSKYVYIQNSQRKTALENYYYASLKQCTKDSIIMIVDGDDELVGRNTLKLFNWGFQTKRAGVIYTNFYGYNHNNNLYAGFTSQYPQQVKKNNRYRNVPARFSHLRAARAQLFYQINVLDLKDNKGGRQFFKVTADVALFLPLMELSCGRVFKIEGQINLLYNVGTGINEFAINRQRQKAVNAQIRDTYPKYSCSKAFNQKMSK